MKKRIAIVAAAALIAAAALVYLYFTGEGEGAGIPCMFHQITGFYCSGCGASRALRSILHFDFYRALRYNAIFTICLPLFAVYFTSLSVSYIRFGKDRVSEKISMKIVWIFIALALIYGVLRNVPAFSFLAPVILGG
ncbi:MAG: DUF2752 domain-containing protein [Oscillospiraceae bacterium]|nr:DUF2752 domain-containing protein [Oscillospiraceae bacterium]